MDHDTHRGIHLTLQISKIAERTIGYSLLPWLKSNQEFGAHQYASPNRRSHEDVLATSVCCWRSMVETGICGLVVS